jgi:hypothetical protein
MLEGPYCQRCGQKDIDLERPLRELVADVVREAFDVDGRAARTIKALFRHPGFLTHEFLAGRRRAYTTPLRLYLVISVVSFVLIAWMASRGVLLEQGQDLEHDAAQQARFMSEDLPSLMFVLLPAFALLLKFVISGRLYFDHLIFSLHLHSATYVMLVLLIPFENLAADQPLALIIQVALLSYFFAYFCMAMRRVYGTNWLGTIARVLAVFFGYLMIVSVMVEATSTFLILSD